MGESLEKFEKVTGALKKMRSKTERGMPTLKNAGIMIWDRCPVSANSSR